MTVVVVVLIVVVAVAGVLERETGMAQHSTDAPLLQGHKSPEAPLVLLLMQKFTLSLRDMVAITLRTDLTRIQRTNLETCITVHMHQKEATEDLVRKKVGSRQAVERVVVMCGVCLSVGGQGGLLLSGYLVVHSCCARVHPCICMPVSAPLTHHAWLSFPRPPPTHTHTHPFRSGTRPTLSG